MQYVVYGHKDSGIILMSIFLYGHYYLLTIDLVNQKYIHYLSIISDTYDDDAVAMVNDSSILMMCVIPI